MTTYILMSVCCLNLAFTIFLLVKIGLVKRSVQDLKVVYFTELTDITGFIKKQKKVQIKAQLLMGDIPLGHPFIVSEQITETVDEAKVQQIVNEIAKPLLRLGITVVSKGLL